LLAARRPAALMRWPADAGPARDPGSDRRDPFRRQQAGHARPPPAAAPRLARWRTPGWRGAAAPSRRR